MHRSIIICTRIILVLVHNVAICYIYTYIVQYTTMCHSKSEIFSMTCSEPVNVTVTTYVRRNGTNECMSTSRHFIPFHNNIIGWHMIGVRTSNDIRHIHTHSLEHNNRSIRFCNKEQANRSEFVHIVHKLTVNVLRVTSQLPCHVVASLFACICCIISVNAPGALCP